MPSKIQLDENLWFLYICLQKSDLKTIDFTAVGASTNLKPPAARMRYTRLRRQIESGTLIGTHGTPFTGSADKIFEASSKRKRGGGGTKKGSEDDTEDEEPVRRKGRRSAEAGSNRRDASDGKVKEVRGKGTGKARGNEKMGNAVKVKMEPGSDFDSTESEFEDSEDEMPLAKLRRSRLGPAPSSSYKSHLSSASKPYISPYPRLNPLGAFGSEVPRSLAAFGIGQGGGGFGRGENLRFGGLGSAFQSPERNEFANSNGGAGWGEVDWKRWQNRFGGMETNRSA